MLMRGRPRAFVPITPVCYPTFIDRLWMHLTTFDCL